MALTPELTKEAKLVISEVFHSLQGESTHAGRPCVFVRLAGCNLRCAWCDARYTYEEPGRTVSIREIIDQVTAHPAADVEITGGEPLLQPEVYPLMSALVAAGRTVLLETNGSILLDQVPAGVITIMDVKCPASGMHQHFLPENLALLRPADEIKFVLADRSDYDYARQIIDRHGLAGRTLLFSPIPSSLPPADLARWILNDRLQVRLQLQLHKIIWPDQDRGV